MRIPSNTTGAAVVRRRSLRVPRRPTGGSCRLPAGGVSARGVCCRNRRRPSPRTARRQPGAPRAEHVRGRPWQRRQRWQRLEPKRSKGRGSTTHQRLTTHQKLRLRVERLSLPAWNVSLTGRSEARHRKAKPGVGLKAPVWSDLRVDRKSVV